MSTIPQRLMIALIVGYRTLFSPWLGGHCRFLPTCSEYALTAVRRHGALRGGWLALRRIGRCHPWHGGGVDPVPPAGAADGVGTGHHHHG